MVTFGLVEPISKGVLLAKQMSIFNRILQGATKPLSGAEAEYAEFKETFFLQPETRLFDYLRLEQVTNLIEWFDPAHPDSVPKTFIRMMNEATRRGMHIWNQTGISMNFDDGVPSSNSQDCLSVLARIFGFTIVGYYREQADGELKKLEFGP